MATKQSTIGGTAPDGSMYVTITDGAGNLNASVGSNSASVAGSQATVGTSATSVVAARATRNTVTIVNGGTTDVFLGPSGVTTTTGILLTGTKGASITIPTTAQIFGIVGAGTQVVSVLETF